MKKLYIISIFMLSSLLTGCYTQLATRDYEREDFGINEGEGFEDGVAYYDTLFGEVDTTSYDTVWVDEDGEIYENLYADYPVSREVVYPEIYYIGGGYYRPYYDYWYYPWYSYYPGCLVPGYGPYRYPGYCGISFSYYGGYYDPYYYNYGGGYGYATSDPKYKYRTNTTHDSRLRDNDGERTSTRTRDGLGGSSFAGRTSSVSKGGTSVASARNIDIDNEIGKSKGSSGVSRNTNNDALKVSSRSSQVKPTAGSKSEKGSRKVYVVRNQDKKTSIRNKSYKGSESRVSTKSATADRKSTGTKIYIPKKNTSTGSTSQGRVYKGDSNSSKRSNTTGKSYKSKQKSSSSKSYSTPRSSGRSSGSKSYSSPSRGSSSRSSYSPSRGSSSGSRSSASRSSGSSSGSSGRSSGKSRR